MLYALQTKNNCVSSCFVKVFGFLNLFSKRFKPRGSAVGDERFLVSDGIFYLVIP